MGLIRLHRRGLLTAAGGVAVAAALPRPGHALTHARWSGYRQRLLARAEDAAGGAWLKEPERALLAYANRERGKAGLASVAWCDELSRAARAHAADMLARGYFDHNSPEGFAAHDRVGLLARKHAGSSGENIASTTNDDSEPSERFHQLWMDSAGHRRNVLRPGWTHAGVGVVERHGERHAATVFAERRVTLAAALPFEGVDAAALSTVLSAGSPTVDRYGLTPAETNGWSSGPEMTAEHALTDRGPLPAGAWRLRPFALNSPREWTILWGPVFLAG